MIFTVYLSPLQSPGVQNPQVFKQCTWINTWPSTHQGHKLPFPHSINCCLGHSKSRTVLWTSTKKMGFPGKELVYQCRRQRFDPWVRKIPWRRKWKCILSILFFFSNILAWEIPWTEEPSGVQSKGLQRLGNQQLKQQQQLKGLGWKVHAHPSEPAALLWKGLDTHVLWVPWTSLQENYPTMRPSPLTHEQWYCNWQYSSCHHNCSCSRSFCWNKTILLIGRYTSHWICHPQADRPWHLPDDCFLKGCELTLSCHFSNQTLWNKSCSLSSPQRPSGVTRRMPWILEVWMIW